MTDTRATPPGPGSAGADSPPTPTPGALPEPSPTPTGTAAPTPGYNGLPEPTPAQAALLHAVRHGWSAKIPGLVKQMTVAERRGCVPALTALRQEVREAWSGTNWRSMALIIAGAGCHTAPSAAAQWIAATGRTGWMGLWLGDDVVHLLAVLSQRDPEWIADVATRLADRRASAWEWPQFPLLERLLLLAGCPVPTPDGFVTRWMDWSGIPHRNRPWDTLIIEDGEVVPTNTGKKKQEQKQKDGAAGDDGTGASGERGTVVDGRVIAPPRRNQLIDRLRDDPFLDTLLPRIFEVPDAGARLVFEYRPEHQWPHALDTLAAEGRLDRRELIDACLSRMLRGERQANLRGFLALLAELAPTLDEQAARATTYLRLLPDSHSTVADLAQQALIAVDSAGRLDPEILVEASRMVLCRPEKKLVRAQLSWLDRAARRDADHVGEIVLAAAEAFSHEDSALAERALTLVGRHHPKAGPGVLPDLRAAAAMLTPTLLGRAAELFGIEKDTPDQDEPTDLLPPVPQPRPLAPPIATPAEVAEEVAAILATRYDEEVDVATFERALDGLVRHAHHDPEGLAAALKPVRNPFEHTWRASWLGGQENIGFVVAALTGDISQDRIRRESAKDRREWLAWSTHRFGAPLTLRLMEIAARVIGDRPPFLLATPSQSTGRIDPGVLVDRLRAYEAAGVEPGEADLDQALLRVGRDAGSDVPAAAEQLTSPAGRRLATWLRRGGLPDPTVKHVVRERSPNGLRLPLTVTMPKITPPVALTPVFARLLGPPDEQPSWPFANGVATLPEHRELMAAQLIYWLAGSEIASRLLPVLAEAGGPAGPALHLGLAYGMGGATREWRTAAVDALLVLAAQRDLDAALLGRDVAETVRLGGVKLTRVAESVREASRTGAYGTVWSVLVAAIPGLLDHAAASGKPLPGLPDVLAVAAECATRSGARGPIPQVTAAAARSGSSRLVKEARLLRDILSRP